MSPAAGVAARTVGDQLWARLKATPLGSGTTQRHFRGKVDDAVVVQGEGEDAVVLNHAILYESPGYRTGSRVGSTRDRYAGDFQVTAVGRDAATCLWVVDQVVTAMTGTLIEIPGHTKLRRIREDPSNRTQSVQPDEDTEPTRFFVPLLFTINT